MSAPQILQTRTPVLRRRPRLDWLTSPAPAYKETLAWLARQRTPPEPATYPHDGGARAPGWQYSPQPAYFETSLAWLGRQRTAPEPATYPHDGGLRTPGWQYGPQPAYSETLSWLSRQHTPPAPATYPDDGGLRIPGWPFGPQPAYTETLAWRRPQAPGELPAGAGAPPRGWFAPETAAAAVMVDYLPWLHRFRVEEAAAGEAAGRALPWLTSPAPAYSEALGWLARLRTPPPYEAAEPSARYVGWQYSPQPAYAEMLGWLSRQRTPPADYLSEPAWQHPGWQYGPQPASAESIVWRHALATVDMPVEVVNWRGPAWQLGPQPAYGETRSWARRPAAAEGEPSALASARGWFAGLSVAATADYLPWLHRVAAVETTPELPAAHLPAPQVLAPRPNVPGPWSPAWRVPRVPPEVESGGGRAWVPWAALLPSVVVIVTLPLVTLATDFRATASLTVDWAQTQTASRDFPSTQTVSRDLIS